MGDETQSARSGGLEGTSARIGQTGDEAQKTISPGERGVSRACARASLKLAESEALSWRHVSASLPKGFSRTSRVQPVALRPCELRRAHSCGGRGRVRGEPRRAQNRRRSAARPGAAQPEAQPA